MTMRVALAKYRYKPEDISLYTEGVAVRGNQPFGCHFRCTVQRRLHGKRTRFRRWKDLGFTVDGPCRSECNTPYSGCAHGFEDVVRGNRIVFQVAARLVGPMPNICVRGKMEYDVVAGYCA